MRSTSRSRNPDREPSPRRGELQCRESPLHCLRMAPVGRTTRIRAGARCRIVQPEHGTHNKLEILREGESKYGQHTLEGVVGVIDAKCLYSARRAK